MENDSPSFTKKVFIITITIAIIATIFFVAIDFANKEINKHYQEATKETKNTQSKPSPKPTPVKTASPAPTTKPTNTPSPVTTAKPTVTPETDEEKLDKQAERGCESIHAKMITDWWMNDDDHNLLEAKVDCADDKTGTIKRIEVGVPQ